MKLYQDLDIDEPLDNCTGPSVPSVAELKVVVGAMTDEERTAQIVVAWITNPGGHFRARIIRQMEQAGLVTYDPVIKFTSPPGAPLVNLNGKRMTIGQLMERLYATVKGNLTEPYDPDRVAG